MFSTSQVDQAERLPRGPHRLTRDEVRAHQRERMLRSIVQHSAAHGYANTSVADIVKGARASRAAFYAQFASREECFLSAYHELMSDLFRELVEVGSQPGDYITGMRDGVRAYLEWLQRWPAGSRVCAVEILTLGAAGLEARERTVVRAQRLFDTIAARARREQAGLPDPPAAVSHAVVLATMELASAHIRAGRLATLRDELEGPLLYLWLLGLAGHDVAAAAVSATTGQLTEPE